MLTVADDPERTERELKAGLLRCPDCQGELRPWGRARPRPLRTRAGTRRLAPRRSCCRGCGATHVLLPTSMLLRRADAVDVIGEALVANVAGEGHRPIAERLGRHPDTVRGWLRRFAARAHSTASHAVRCVYRLDASAGRVDPTAGTTTATQTALAALGLAVAAVERFLQRRVACRWHVVAGLCSGLLLANTSRPYPPL